MNKAKTRTGAKSGKLKGQKKIKVSSHLGRAVVVANMNNTIITITTEKGDTIASKSGGSTEKKYKGSRKSTPAAAEEAAKEVAKKVLGMGMTSVAVIIKGPGSGRDAAVKGLYTAGLSVSMITDATPIPHNGCRRRKERRI